MSGFLPYFFVVELTPSKLIARYYLKLVNSLFVTQPSSSSYPIYPVIRKCGPRRRKSHKTQWRTEGVGGLRCSTPPPRNSEDIGGVLDRISKKDRCLDFLLQFTVFSYGCNLLNKGFLLIQTVWQWRIWFRSSNPPRHPESLTKSSRIAN